MDTLAVAPVASVGRRSCFVPSRASSVVVRKAATATTSTVCRVWPGRRPPPSPRASVGLAAGAELTLAALTIRRLTHFLQRCKKRCPRSAQRVRLRQLLADAEREATVHADANEWSDSAGETGRRPPWPPAGHMARNARRNHRIRRVDFETLNIDGARSWRPCLPGTGLPRAAGRKAYERGTSPA